MLKRAFLLCTLLAVPGTVSHDLHLAGPDTPVSEAFFGMHFHDFQPGEAWPAVSFAEWRLWDTGTTWADLEPQKDHWNFTRLDNLIQQAEQHHVRVLLTLGQTPAWASPYPEEKDFHGGGAAHAPRDMDDWTHYIDVLATRYKGRIEAYEMWNEPGFPRYYLDSPESLAEMTRQAAVVLRRVDPAAKVVTPSPTGIDGLPWFKGFLGAGGGIYADAIGYHLYVTPQPPEAELSLIKQVQAAMADAGVAGKPIWNTESTWGSVKGGLDPSLQRAYLARSLLLAAVAGIDRFYWYSWDNHNWANIVMVSPDNRQPLGPATAYRITRDQMLGATIQNCTQQGTLWVCRLDKPSGQTYVAWTSSGTAQWRPPSATGAHWSTQTLNDVASNGTGTVTLSQEPIFVKLIDLSPSTSR